MLGSALKTFEQADCCRARTRPSFRYGRTIRSILVQRVVAQTAVDSRSTGRRGVQGVVALFAFERIKPAPPGQDVCCPLHQQDIVPP